MKRCACVAPQKNKNTAELSINPKVMDAIALVWSYNKEVKKKVIHFPLSTKQHILTFTMSTSNSPTAPTIPQPSSSAEPSAPLPSLIVYDLTDKTKEVTQPRGDGKLQIKLEKYLTPFDSYGIPLHIMNGLWVMRQSRTLLQFSNY